MENKNLFRKTLSVIAGTVFILSSIPFMAVAEDTAPAETVSEDVTESITVSAETTAVADTEEVTEEQPVDWFKAELDEYDDSLSLISYESANKNKIKEPTPVELNVTGGFVGDIPWLESEVSIESNPGQFAFVTYGWGHGVGMSQNGANFYAAYSGWTYQDILFHYYPGTYLMNTGLAEDEEITVNGVSGDVLSMVSQIVYNEIGGTMNYEAMKAQAVAVYSYCKYNGNDANDLRCKPYPPQVVVDAVSEVLGQALYYDSNYALTMFSASSGGITANCTEVFYSDLPYLRSVSSDYDAAYDPHYGTVTYIDDFQLKHMIESAYNIELSDNPENWVKASYSDSTGYVTYVNIDDQITVKGYEFKLAMDLKSSKFNVFYTPRADGEEIPDETSTPVVVDPDYNYTPAVIYPNSYPTDIGGNIPEEVVEEPEEPTEEFIDDETYEDYDNELSNDWYSEPVQPYDTSYDYSYGDLDY